MRGCDLGRIRSDINHCFIEVFERRVRYEYKYQRDTGYHGRAEGGE